jgi:hypothetical protein
LELLLAVGVALGELTDDSVDAFDEFKGSLIHIEVFELKVHVDTSGVVSGWLSEEGHNCCAFIADEGGWCTARAVYKNRARVGRTKGRAMQRKRGELIERSFAHVLETGGHRRARLRGRDNITKRYLVHVAGFNLSLVLRKVLGFGTPRGFASAQKGLLAAALWLWAFIRTVSAMLLCQRHIRRTAAPMALGDIHPRAWGKVGLWRPVSSTGS